MKNRKLRCIVDNCYESGQQDSSSMYKFPINPVVRQKWMDNIGDIKYMNLFNSRVCRRHFETQCFGKTKVFSWAVPTLYLNKQEVVHQVSKPSRNVFIRRCSVRNCPSRSPPERLHFFPANPEMRKEWMEICRLTLDNKWLFICGRHFRQTYLPNSKGNLRKDAIPEFHLGTEEEDPLGKSITSMKSCSNKSIISFKSDDSGIDEESFKERKPHDPCANCLDLKQQLAAALLRVQQLEEKKEQEDTTDSDEEEEHIFILMK
ncbi:uncharacterized protein LOC6537258 [Drosophila yakuba]|uniref:THAP-type domain-containing protein n=1 Tax=Drosophila yakuba TaxID=7245 RepID=B4PSN2_DROYA|nr:uncharacterized protein LOC6537258 [Drosophila yakuba]EDW97528.1 uncharacterized protein Dyak_GE24264 [Drosophila yakuba]